VDISAASIAAMTSPMMPTGSRVPRYCGMAVREVSALGQAALLGEVDEGGRAPQTGQEEAADEVERGALYMVRAWSASLAASTRLMTVCQVVAAASWKSIIHADSPSRS
jgi:hypothetical protein